VGDRLRARVRSFARGGPRGGQIDFLITLIFLSPLSLCEDGSIMRRVLTFGVMIAFAACAQARIYKCVDASGKTSYMESPCPSGVESMEMTRQGQRAALPALASARGADTADKAAEPKVAAAQSGLQLPAPPADRNFTQDYAYLIDSDKALDAIAAAQHDAYVHHDTPIMVVTIASMARFGGEGYSIEKFARAWFNHWQIGKRASNGELIDRGILLLVSRDDRKARIELGADWGHRFDARTDRIMSQDIVPKFKSGDYSMGIAGGVRELASMAKLDPAGRASILERASSTVQNLGRNNALTPLPAYGVFTLVGIGLLMVIGSLFVEPPGRYRVLLNGVGMTVAALVFWVVFAVIAVLGLGWLVVRYGNVNMGGGRSYRYGESWGAGRSGLSDAGGGDSGGSDSGGGDSGGGDSGGGSSGSW